MMYKFHIRGVVQGVGFRPYIYNACLARGLLGYVQNIGDGVVILVNDKRGLEEILKNIPEGARIDTITTEEVTETYENFSIRESSGRGYAEIPPDKYLCEECTRELFERGNRREGYFFITCTACGPRFTITEKSPYDRDTTTMREFPMCPKCAREYKDPADRRFHAQTIACHDCGPRLALAENGREISGISDAEKLERTAKELMNGKVVAIKGVGGFHLACATTKEAIALLNATTGRSDKPYAIMCPDIASAKELAEMSEKEERMLFSPERPIVLLKKKKEVPVSELDSVGIMLPYTALHLLLFRYYPYPLVMTSSNMSNEPITTEEKEQFVPTVLTHDRKIANSADDSVIKFIDDTPLLIRRSRGFVPGTIHTGRGGKKAILALGAEMNNTFALYDGAGGVILSQHLGNTSNADSFAHYKETIKKFLEHTGISPTLIARDLHPSYNTSLYGEELSRELGIPLRSVQHHRAHAFGVAEEHGLNEFVAIVCDGMGYGDDGTIWGGEIFANEERIGHLETQIQLGGDSATRFPHKMLFSILRKFLTLSEVAEIITPISGDKELAILDAQLSERFNAPETTSTGRVLDAVSAFLQLAKERTYDGRHAMLLESIATEPYELEPVMEGTTLLTTPLFEFLVKNREKDPGRLSATAQTYLAEGLYTIAKAEGKPIAFSGGCAYNRIMTKYLKDRGVLLNKEVPPGDGGISFGQVAYLLNQSQK